MKNIVLYTVPIMVALLMLSSDLISQKPAIDLLPFTNHRRHPEAILDTGFTSDTQIVIVPLAPAIKSPSSSIEEKAYRPAEQNRKWVDFDSLSQRQVLKNENSAKSSMNYTLIFKFISPIKLFLYITALKN